jgi:hypothetical protein
LERERLELSERAEIGGKSPRQTLGNQVDGGDSIVAVAIHVFPLTGVCAGGPSARGGVEGGEELGHDGGVIGGGEG